MAKVPRKQPTGAGPARKPTIHPSHFSDKALGTIVGLGSTGYEYALDHALSILQATR
jgi:3-dehydroquinate dehydratase